MRKCKDCPAGFLVTEDNITAKKEQVGKIFCNLWTTCVEPEDDICTEEDLNFKWDIFYNLFTIVETFVLEDRDPNT